MNSNFKYDKKRTNYKVLTRKFNNLKGQQLPKLKKMIYQKFSLWLSRIFFWAKISPEDAVVNVTTTIEPKCSGETNDRLSVI